MDKTYYLKIFILLFVFSAIVFQSQVFINGNKFLLKNVEALASDQNDDLAGKGKKCYSVIKNLDEGPYSVTRCSTCMDVKCTDYSESAKCVK